MLVKHEPISTLSVSAVGWGTEVMKRKRQDLPYVSPCPPTLGPQKADPNWEGYLLVFPSGPFPVRSVVCFLHHQQEAKNRAGPLESGCLAL